MRKTIWFFYLSVIVFSSCSDKNGWDELFNGKNLDGWHVYGGGESYNGWYVDNGVLVFDPEQRTEARSSNLITDGVYMNFELSVEWMISERGNSGVFWSVVEDDKYEHPYQTGPEIQILDDGWDEYIKERGDKTRAGSIFGIQAPSEIVSKGAGQWNHYLLHIHQDLNEGFLEFNGTVVLRFPVNGSEWLELISESHFADWEGFAKSREGRISLQDHGSKVAFRNIKIRKL